MKNTLSAKYNNDNIGSHWEVDATPASFSRLINHLNFSTQNYNFFNRAINDTISISNNKDLVVVDLGAGVGWTSAIMSFDPRIKKIYVIEPTIQRLNQIKNVFKHFSCDIKKLEIIKSTFTNFKIHEKVDIFVLHGAFHHCYNKDIKIMFNNIKEHLKENSSYDYIDFLKRNISINTKSKVLISGEHFLNRYILIWRFFKSFFLLKIKRNDIDKYSGEHNRFEREIKKIFYDNNFNYKFTYLKGDMIDPMLLKKSFLKKILYKYNIQALYYYYCILDKKN